AHRRGHAGARGGAGGLAGAIAAWPSPDRSTSARGRGVSGRDLARGTRAALAGAARRESERGEAGRRRRSSVGGRRRPYARAVGFLAIPPACVARGTGGRPEGGSRAHRRCARPRSERLAHLARIGAHRREGWFHRGGTQKPCACQGAESPITAFRDEQGLDPALAAKHGRAAGTALAIASLVLACALAPAGAQAASRPLRTSIQDPFLYQSPPVASIVASRMRDAGATWVRLDIGW